MIKQKTKKKRKNQTKQPTKLSAQHYDLFFRLKWGPVTPNDILSTVFKDGDSLKKPYRRMMYIINRMIELGYIRSHVSHVFNTRAYSLTKSAACLLCAESGLELSTIFYNVSDRHIEHDICQAAVIWNVVKNRKGYEVLFQIPECGLRREGQNQYGLCFTDIKVKIKYNGKIVDIDFEIDYGTVSRRDIISKLEVFEDVIVIITTTPKRLNMLLGYVRNPTMPMRRPFTYAKEKLRITPGVGPDAIRKKRIYIATFANFEKTDLLKCKFHTNFSEEPTTLNL